MVIVTFVFNSATINRALELYDDTMNSKECVDCGTILVVISIFL